MTWLEAGEHRQSKVHKEISVKKVMVAVFWDAKGIIHCEFVPEGRSVNAVLYHDMLRRLREAVRRKHPDIWRNCCTQFWLQHDGAPVHRSRLVIDFCANNNMKLVLHPPYSPDITLSDFFLFTRLKRNMRGICYCDLDVLRQTIDHNLGNIPAHEFAHAMQDSWRKRLLRCVVTDGDYFED